MHPRRVYGALRRLLFHMDPERAHELATSLLATAQGSPFLLDRLRPGQERTDRLATTAFGIQLPAPVGLAAGFDKHARCYNALLALGFGHVEVGTVTPRPQEGNPRPRIWRYPDYDALVNRLGFNNPGIEAAAKHLATTPPEGIVGVNVGRNKDTPPDEHAADYAQAAARLAPQAAYVTVNVSSPNTPGLRNLQAPQAAAKLVQGVLEALDDAGSPRPVLLKLHPDADPKTLAQVSQAAVDAGASGIVAVNTTTSRPEGLEDAPDGGLSGRPLKERATRVVAELFRSIGEEVPIVGVGGIETGRDAIDRMRAGASVLQAYTGFVYRGPRFPQRVHEEMVKIMDEEGIGHVSEIVGQGVREGADGMGNG